MSAKCIRAGPVIHDWPSLWLPLTSRQLVHADPYAAMAAKSGRAVAEQRQQDPAIIQPAAATCTAPASQLQAPVQPDNADLARRCNSQEQAASGVVQVIFRQL